jgi:endonuclease III
MSSSNRPALLNKIRLALRKKYKPAVPRGEQPVLETLLFACCLENTPHDTAERVFSTLRTSFFDWNEIRVTTVKELSEVLHMLPDASAAAANLKGVLQSTFESEYSFELESIKKKNLGDAIKRLNKLEGVSPFVIAYATQVSLGGHSIPIDRGALGALYVLGAITEAEYAAHSVPGLERAIPKNKGVEFGMLLHELSAEFIANPFSPALRDWLSSIAPDAKDRFPKRVVKKPTPEPAPAPATPPKPAPAAKKSAPPPPPATKKKESPPVKKAAASPKPAPAAKKKQPSASGQHKKTVAKSLAKRKPR